MVNIDEIHRNQIIVDNKLIQELNEICLELFGICKNDNDELNIGKPQEKGLLENIQDNEFCIFDFDDL